jgi:hypothetical protein
MMHYSKKNCGECPFGLVSSIWKYKKVGRKIRIKRRRRKN